MTTIGLDHHVSVLVCDGRKALLLENCGYRIFPKLGMRAVLEDRDAPACSFGTGTPCSSLCGTEERGTTIEHTHLKARAEQNFLREVAEQLDCEMAGSHLTRLIVVAPARALEMLRRTVSPSVKSTVVAEIERDLVRTPIYEIERHLSHLLSKQPGCAALGCSA